MSNVARKPILISGAGLASLLFAQGLRRAHIPFTIFERDQSFTFRAQGYRLRLSAEGLDAVESVLDGETWQKFWATSSKTGGSGLVTVNVATGENVPSDTKTPTPAAAPKQEDSGLKLASRGGKVIGMSRGDMRKIFMSGIESHIKWGQKVTGYESTSSGVRVVFGDGSKSEEGELLVGGEGIYSKVATQLSKGKLKVYDTGARGIHGQAPHTAFGKLGEGVWRMVDESNERGKLFVITNVRPSDDPNELLGWTMGAAPGVIKAPGDDYTMVGKPAADIAKSLTSDWHERLRPLFEHMDEPNAAFWKITCSTPSGVPEWDNEPRVTVIGDAAHSMTPAGGLGANTAMRDSALLSTLLAKAGGWSDEVTAEYEKEMRVYGSEAVGRSYGMATDQFGATIDENTPTVNL